MKKKLIATLLGTSFILSINIAPVSAEVLIKNGQPQVASVSWQTYADEGWSGYPDYHQQVVNPRDIFEGPTEEDKQRYDIDGSWELGGACESTAILWLYNWKGIHPEATMWSMNRKINLQEFFDKKAFEEGFNAARINRTGMSNSQISQACKDYLDKGCILEFSHPQLVIGYAIKDGKTWFEIMQTQYAAQPNEKWHMWISEEEMVDTVGATINVVAKDLSVTPIQCSYKRKDGSDKSTIVYVDKLGKYYYSLDTLADFFADLTPEKVNWYKSKISNVSGQINTILQKNFAVNINNQAYGWNDKLQVIDGKIATK